MLSRQKEKANNNQAVVDGSHLVSPPTLSLSKGGGAIRGIGEKFAANPVTGTGSLSVPIFTSPGRSGFGPQLSLSYDSGAGNGPFGFGWSLSLPSITRKTDKGLPKYQDTDESDVFILSGAEDLVPLLVEVSGQWQRAALHRTVNGMQYRIQRYWPRIEGLFARIERWENNQTAEVHWRSISRDNVTTLYGRTQNSRIADPLDSSRVFSWLICESRDDKGNAIVYEYAPEDSRGVDTTLVHERNRSELSRSTNRYIKRIKYGNQVSHLTEPDLSQTSWLFEVVFDYEEAHYEELPLDPSRPEADQHRLVLASASAGGAWPVRPDPISVYRPSFEIRTYRRCSRVLMFHRFAELGNEPYLVRSTEFGYADFDYGRPAAAGVELTHRGSTRFASSIRSVSQSGYVRDENAAVVERSGARYVTYLKKSLPQVEFEYSQALVDETVRDVDTQSLENLPVGADGLHYQWLDLDGEGLQGILSEQEDAWYYKRNLSAIAGVARFQPVVEVSMHPSIAEGVPRRHQFLDLAGDGQLDVVQFENVPSGFFERTRDEGWNSFIPFESVPNVSWSDPNLKFLDLTGDGHADLLITENEALTWYPSLAEEGFGTAIRIPKPHDEEKGPAVVFADGTQAIFAGDMSGDGLADIVRIRNGEVCYWPNLGYGQFGAKVTMSNAPWFDPPDEFDQNRIRLADIDGSGITDIIYLASDGIRLFFNQSGNGWNDAQTLLVFPRVDNLTSVQAVDLLGNGTACLVWTSPLTGYAGQPMRYIDLMGGQKPHLLTRVANSLGAETVVHYAPSTKFFLADKLAGKPWITRLPFPVHVVERVETFDRISRNRFVTRYAYHHGYFDGLEREFRGFGMVEQWDTEEFASLSSSDDFPVGDNVNVGSHVPAVLTKTWFHTGAYLEGGDISRQFDQGYYREGDPSLGEAGLTEQQRQAMLLRDTVLPTSLSPEEILEACRSLKGEMLRQEIYALDNKEESDRPYSVSERNYSIKRLQPRGANQQAVFFTHPREAIDFHYERKLYDIAGQKRADPRVSHTMILDVDDFGNVLKSVAMGYGRRHNLADPVLTPQDRQKQQRTFVTYTENRYTNTIEQYDAYRTPLPCETRTFETLRITPDTNQAHITNLFRFDEMQAKIQAASDGNHDIAYEDINAIAATAPHPYRRVIEHTRMLYRRDDLTGPLPLAQAQSLALPFENYKLALTPNLAKKVYIDSGKLTTAELNGVLQSEGRYVHSEGDANWWIPSGQVFYSPGSNDTFPREQAYARQHFFLSHRFRDPFGETTVVTYDSYDLLMQESHDPLGNAITVGERNAAGVLSVRGNDYRVLQPRLIMDPNRNRAAVTFDALGLVAGTAVMGKPEESLGDALAGFEPDLNHAALLSFIAAPRTQAPALLKQASTRIVYDLDRFRRSGEPPFAAILARETHASDPAPAGGLEVQVSFTYSDGFGREIQKKIQAEPGPVVEGGPTVTPRWVGSGWTIFNNKGKPVRQYEPFFSATHGFEFAKIVGVSPVLFYDPVERVIATLHPNHTYEKVVFDPWHQETWDVNDTVKSDPRTDPDTSGYVAEYFKQIAPNPNKWETWLQQQGVDPLNPPQDTPALTPEKKAAVRTLPHAQTPMVVYVDTLGRTFLTIADNGFAGKYRTTVELDFEGNQREVTDAQDRVVMRYDYDMCGDRVHQASMEAGERWMLNDVAGKPIRSWDSRGFARRITYDVLRRPRELFVGDVPGNERLAERTLYGEGQGEATNHRGRVYQVSDGAGSVTNEAYDFKGNLLRGTRRLLLDYKNPVDWNQNPALEDEGFASSTSFDGLSRVVQQVTPHSSNAGTRFNVIQPTYNEANLLERVDAWLQQSAEPADLLDATTASFHTVTNINYNSKGQQELIEYGNGAKTSYEYDSLTFRLIHLQTLRDAERLQDLFYTYDPAGNITNIRDDAQQTIYFNGQVAEPHNEYKYDPIYRLVMAEGREHIGQVGQPTPQSWDEIFSVNLPHPHDGQAMRHYTENYEYDAAGNIMNMIHLAANGNWTRSYTYNEPSLFGPVNNNRLTSTTVGATTETYSYSAPDGLHGNMTRMLRLPVMEWDFKDQLHATQRQAVNSSTGETTYYVYDVAGERVRKITERENGTRYKERSYLGEFEIYREYGGNGDTLALERETLHIMDDKQCIALVETKTREAGLLNRLMSLITSPEPLIRYQFSNHLGSAYLELDDQAEPQVISYEEYYPYGGTSYQAVRSDIEVPQKRYRYSGKERDEESGLYYYGARYYPPWVGRWVSCDPIGNKDSNNLYVFINGNP
ncbi:MAG: SpvB/TcaC N-terminal domain-containing protein, partial [Candidatus Binatia bacterium]